MTKEKAPLGLVLYQGPSVIGPHDIVAILTYQSDNKKLTGGMSSRLAALWILLSDVDPITAAREGIDRSICGDCRMRPTDEGGCYVSLLRGPLTVWRAHQRKRYVVAQDGDITKAVRGMRIVRLGAYGDPAALPDNVHETLQREVACVRPHERPKILGYTHQWKTQPQLAATCMASTHSVAEAEAAVAAGFRPFLLRPDATTVVETSLSHFVCPASNEANHRLSCSTCRACDGSRGNEDRRAWPVIAAHHSPARLKKLLAATQRWWNRS